MLRVVADGVRDRPAELLEREAPLGAAAARRVRADLRASEDTQGGVTVSERRYFTPLLRGTERDGCCVKPKAMSRSG